MKTKEYHNDNIGTVLKCNRKIVERGKINTLTHKYMTAHFPGLVHALSKLWQELI
jgi:hypothetical protein